MQFVHYDLELAATDVVEVTLDKQANVRLMDTQNFSLYLSGQSHRCYGGLVKTSPFRLRAPGAGQWHLAIDLGGGAGQVRTSVRTIRRSR